MKLSQIITKLEKFAPIKFAESWDNVGLLVGDPNQEIQNILICIDYTQNVLQEALAQGCNLVIAYHPPIFAAQKSFVSGHLAYESAYHHIAIYSPHTAWDIAKGGTNDVIAELLNLQQVQPLRYALPTAHTHYKLVTFIPHHAFDKVSSALFRAGSGQMGEYSHCSFRHPGTGTFMGNASTHPAVGSSGQFEQVDEYRLETIVPAARVDEVVNALKANHPYEEPAFDLMPLTFPVSHGIGRIGTLPSVARHDFMAQLKTLTQLPFLLIAGSIAGNVERIAICVGSGNDLLREAIKQKADIYITGELSHHHALLAVSHGLTTVCLLHSSSERLTLPKLQKRIQSMIDLPIKLSLVDKEIFQIL